MSDTMAEAIKAAEAWIAERKTPRMQGRKSVPTRPDEWLTWHRYTVAGADGTRARLAGQRLKASQEELPRALELMDELQAISDRAQAEAKALEPRARL
jgi:hypothetical protein